jgi:hypothetical protein
MKLAIMQPYLFPYIGYFQLIHAVDKFIFYDDVNFIKQGWINRNRIIISGNVSYITVPLQNASSFSAINHVAIQHSDKSNWRAKWLKTIQQSYGKAHHFEEVYPLIESVISPEYETISQLAARSVGTICNYLEIKTPLYESSKDYGHTNHLRRADRVIEICKLANSNEYINPIGGIELYSKDEFLKQDINLHFIKPKEIQYKQFNQPFQPWLSMVDVLMHNTKDEIQSFLNEYQLS